MRSRARKGKYDAVVLGGGPGGASVGLMLAKAGWRVAIVEKSEFPRRKVCGDFISAATLMLLAELGLAARFRDLAGPEVRRVGLFERDMVLTAPMPQTTGTAWGRALGREHLDYLLLSAAREAGAELWQPWNAHSVQQQAAGWLCSLNNAGRSHKIFAPILIVGTGSWGRRPVAEDGFSARSDSDLLGFKAYYRDCDLEPDLMPLLAFPGGYGGMVHSDGGRVSLSCCIQRGILRSRRTARQRAADTVLQHVRECCLGAEAVLNRATVDGTWLAVGPIRPGVRSQYSNGVFFVGNVAGEAHPIIAEGISMAIQSAWILCRCLTAYSADIMDPRRLEDIGRDYRSNWSTAFAFRIHAAALLAAFAIHPTATALARPMLKSCPSILTLGAYLSGKSKTCG